MRGYDPNSDPAFVIVAKDGNPEAPDLYVPKLNPSPQTIAAQGYETIVSGAQALPYSKERDTTYETDSFGNPMPYRY